jgi:hypothetical protein
MMERSEILTAMGELKLYGMKAAYDEILSTAVKRQHEPQRIVGDLITAEISEKQARSIRYQIAIAKRPLAKHVDDFQFDDTPINETLVRHLGSGDFLAHVHSRTEIIAFVRLGQALGQWVRLTHCRARAPLPLGG